MASVVKERRSRRGITYRVDFRDRSGQRADERGKLYALRGFDYRPAADKVRANISRFEQLRGTGQCPDAELMVWISTLSDPWRAKLVAAGLIDPEQVGTMRPLSEHLGDFHAALLAKATTRKQADLAKFRMQSIIDGCKFRFFGDITGSKVSAGRPSSRNDRQGRHLAADVPLLPSGAQPIRPVDAARPPSNREPRRPPSEAHGDGRTDPASPESCRS